MRVMGMLVAALVPGLAEAQGLRGASLTWFVYSPTTAQLETTEFTLDPLPDSSARLWISCSIQDGDGNATPDPGPVAGQCRIADAEGNGWVEAFRCDLPDALPLGLLPGGVATEACRGTIVIEGGTGTFAGLTGQGTMRQARLADLPDGRVIGLTMRLYDDR